MVFISPSTLIGVKGGGKLSGARCLCGKRVRRYNRSPMERGAQPQEVVLGDVSKLLRAWRDGDQSALQKLTPIVYSGLHRLARRYMRAERVGHSLQTTALVNEAYMRLVDYKRMKWQNRAHFFAVSAQLMRRILVDHARRRNLKRGGALKRVSLEDTAILGGNPGATWSRSTTR